MRKRCMNAAWAVWEAKAFAELWRCKQGCAIWMRNIVEARVVFQLGSGLGVASKSSNTRGVRAIEAISFLYEVLRSL